MVNKMNLSEITKEIRFYSEHNLDFTELEDSTIFVSKNFLEVLKSEGAEADELLQECVKYLKLMCSKGSSFQNLIINTSGMLKALKEIVAGGTSNLPENIDLKCFQLVANLTVKNEVSLLKIWESMKEEILEKFRSDDRNFVNVAAMIIYNTVLRSPEEVDQDEVVVANLNHYSSLFKTPEKKLPDFVQILMDFFICDSEDVLEIYKKLRLEDKKIFLFYVHDHVEEENSKIISKELLQHLTFEFKKKSDCILKTVETYVDSIDPDTIVALLDIISSTSTQEKYLELLKEDRALFLNLGCLLQALHKTGKNSDSIFTPIQKLEVLAQTSEASSEFEKELSYSFKTKLVKSLANLSHRNKRNQELAREMEIMQSIFECTNADARNPLIKEWSILAIRNLCEDNLENQEMVRSLTKVSDAPNPLLKEMGLENGMVRIGKE